MAYDAYLETLKALKLLYCGNFCKNFQTHLGPKIITSNWKTVKGDFYRLKSELLLMKMRTYPTTTDSFTYETF